MRLLAGQKTSGRHGTGVNVLFANINAQALQLNGYIPTRALAVVGEEEKRNVCFLQAADEAGRSGNEMAIVLDNTIHVDQISKIHKYPVIFKLPQKEYDKQITVRVLPVCYSGFNLL